MIKPIILIIDTISISWYNIESLYHDISLVRIQILEKSTQDVILHCAFFDKRVSGVVYASYLYVPYCIVLPVHHISVNIQAE